VLQFFFFVKAAALKQQISKFYQQILSTQLYFNTNVVAAKIHD